MSTTSEERREVAENLRHLSYGNSVRYKEEFFELLDETVMEPGTGYHEMNDVFDRLADLIDTQERTCRVVRDELPIVELVCYISCSECNFEWFWGYCEKSPRFCPICGAKVVEE